MNVYGIASIALLLIAMACLVAKYFIMNHAIDNVTDVKEEAHKENLSMSLENGANVAFVMALMSLLVALKR